MKKSKNEIETEKKFWNIFFSGKKVKRNNPIIFWIMGKNWKNLRIRYNKFYFVSNKNGNENW